MNRLLLGASVAVAISLVGAVCYGIGSRAGFAEAKEGFGPVLASVQADLGLTKLQRLRELEADLTRSCAKEALAKVRLDIDVQLDLLASLYREYKGTWVVGELVKRDPTVPRQLEGFKKQFGTSWTEPRCAA
jgi:isocitrate dehydrogenase kinase/phosphatase